MRIIAFPQFNSVRFHHVVASFYNQWFAMPMLLDTQSSIATNTDVAIQLPTPSQVAKVESLFFINNSNQPQRPSQRLSNRWNPIYKFSSLLKRPRVVPIHFGVSFNEYIDRTKTTLDINHIKEILLDDHQVTKYPYFISMGSSHVHTRTPITIRNCCIVVALRSNTNAYTQAQAYFHATLYRRIIQDVMTTPPAIAATSTPAINHTNDDRDLLEIVEQRVREIFPNAWESFVIECDKAGWDLSRTELHSKGYEIAYQQ